MLLNLSNHPSSAWLDNQKQTALDQYEEIIDWAFPQINPNWSADEIDQLAEEYEEKIKTINPVAVHIMGEMTFCYNLINRLKQNGIACIASTTNRKTTEKNGVKNSIFEFVRFRKY